LKFHNLSKFLKFLRQFNLRPVFFLKVQQHASNKFHKLYKVSKVPNKISEQLFFEGAKMLETSLKFRKFQKVDTNSLTSKNELDQTSNFFILAKTMHKF
jgi:hypothetical protein